MHALTIGRTLSGKTLLNKILCSDFRSREIERLVLDPMADDGWDTDYRFRDADRFLAVAKDSRECALFIDESGSAVGHHNPVMDWLTTQSRHWGHRTFLICQRAQQLSPTLRTQCSLGYIFRVAPSDAKILSEEFCSKAILEAPDLQQFEFLYCNGFSPVRKMRVNPVTMRIENAAVAHSDRKRHLPS